MSTQKPTSATQGASRSPRKEKEEGNNDHNLPGIGNYLFQKTVGEGNFAKVKLAKHKLTGAEVAVKIIDKSCLDEKKLNKLYREVRIMKLLHHPHIVKLYEVIETKSTLFLVMEYSSGGELYDYLVVHGKMKEKEARAKFRQILSAVSYCHKKKVIHRDLKAENLLLDANLDIKIADFGFSNYFDPDAKLDTFCGSPPYAAPELFQGRRYTGPEVDIWSLGVILYVLTTGCLPFDGKNLQEMRESVCRGKYRIPFYLSDTCEKLLRKFLIRDPFKRASLDMLIDDVWINEGYDCSPIQVDQGEIVIHDDSIVKLIEQRFKVDRQTVMQSLGNGTYDDIAAVYYLMYHEKSTRGKIEGEILTMQGSNVQSLLTASPTTILMPDIGGTGQKDASTTVTSKSKAAATVAPGVKKISEDENQEEEISDLPAAGSSQARPLRTQAPRKRRVTVGGENEFSKLGDEDPDAKNLLKKIQGENNNEREGSVEQTQQKQQQQQQHQHQPTPVIKEQPQTQQQQKRPPNSNAARPISTIETSKPIPFPTSQASSKPPPIARSPEEPEEAGSSANATGGVQPRKRHNTIVGILRGALKNPIENTSGSDLKQVYSPTQDKGQQDFPTGPHHSDSDNDVDPADRPGEPRSLRFTFNSNSTSTKLPEEIVGEVANACKKHFVIHKVVQKFLVECQFAGVSGELVKFEVEVCKLPRLKNLCGLRFKRLAGASLEYKEICEKILASVQL